MVLLRVLYSIHQEPVVARLSPGSNVFGVGPPIIALPLPTLLERFHLGHHRLSASVQPAIDDHRRTCRALVLDRPRTCTYLDLASSPILLLEEAVIELDILICAPIRSALRLCRRITPNHIVPPAQPVLNIRLSLSQGQSASWHRSPVSENCHTNRPAHRHLRRRSHWSCPVRYSTSRQQSRF